MNACYNSGYSVQNRLIEISITSIISTCFIPNKIEKNAARQFRAAKKKGGMKKETLIHLVAHATDFKHIMRKPIENQKEGNVKNTTIID